MRAVGALRQPPQPAKPSIARIDQLAGEESAQRRRCRRSGAPPAASRPVAVEQRTGGQIDAIEHEVIRMYGLESEADQAVFREVLEGAPKCWAES